MLAKDHNKMEMIGYRPCRVKRRPIYTRFSNMRAASRFRIAHARFSRYYEAMSTLRFLTAGESHGPALTAILEGMPAGLPLSSADLSADLARRQRGFGAGDRMAIEEDHAQILSGVMEGRTTGAPITLLITNKDHAAWKGKEITAMTIPRPGHADLAAAVKYGYDDFRLALERASARETAARVAVGAVCRKYLEAFGIRIGGWVTAIGDVQANTKSLLFPSCIAKARESDVSCPDPEAVIRMRAAISKASEQGETLGGIVSVVALGTPVGLGSHVHWDRKLKSRLAAVAMSIPAVKGMEIGDAFEMARHSGTQTQDAIIREGDQIVRPTNRSGGIEGGISNGQPILMRVSIKPIPTTLKPQTSIDLATGQSAETRYERSDTCPVPRAVPVVEACLSFVLAEALIEKLGGDSLMEQQPRFAALQIMHVDTLRMNAEPHCFWP